MGLFGLGSSLVLGLSPVVQRARLPSLSRSKGPLSCWLAGQVFMECLSCLFLGVCVCVLMKC